MTLRPLNRDLVRELDRRAVEEFGIPSIVLMENAGREAARYLCDQPDFRSPVAICCGRGNNGGDGFVIARHLEAAGHSVTVLLAADPNRIDGDAGVQWRILQASATPILRWDAARLDSPAESCLRSAYWIVDALLGTGLQGEVHGPMRSAIEQLNACPAKKFAVDIPSGLDCDTGTVLGVAVRAHHTATFAAAKIGFSNPNSKPYTGTVRVCDIGFPKKLLQPFAAP